MFWGKFEREGLVDFLVFGYYMFVVLCVGDGVLVLIGLFCRFEVYCVLMLVVMLVCYWLIEKEEVFMVLWILGKNVDVGDVLCIYVIDWIEDVFLKYFMGGFIGYVMFSREGIGFKFECMVYLDMGIVL